MGRGELTMVFVKKPVDLSKDGVAKWFDWLKDRYTIASKRMKSRFKVPACFHDLIDVVYTDI